MNSRDDPLPWTDTQGEMNIIRLGFVTTDQNGVDTYDYNSIPLHSGGAYRAFDAVRDDMATAIRARVFSDRTTIRSWGLFDFSDEGGQYSRQIKQDNNLLDSHFECTVRSVMKIQNQTSSDENDAGERTKNTDVVDSNPLEGKQYTFKSGAPKLRTQFRVPGNELEQFQNDLEVNGLILAPNDQGLIYDTGNSLFSPPMGKTLFDNCIASAPIRLQPGSFKSSSSTFKYSGTVRNFFKQLAAGTGTRFTMGQTTLFGLEPAMRTSDQEIVKIAYNLEFDSYSHLKPKIKVHLPQSNLSANVNGL